MNNYYTYQDFEQHDSDRAKWIGQAIAQYMRSDDYKTAKEADQYERQLNTTINNFVKMVYDVTGVGVPDFTSNNNRIASNFFHRLITQRLTYVLGNGVSFVNKTKETQADMTVKEVDKTKEELGKDFDNIVFEAARNALKHGWSYTFNNDGDFYVFPMTEFLAFCDEETGKIRAGVRFWSLDWKKRPIIVDLYEEDGYSRYKTKHGKTGLGALEEVEKKRPYKEIIRSSEADGEEVIGGTNYPSIPIAILYGSKLKQSALVGMKPNIDAFDLIHSGYANDLCDCAQIYWLLNNAAGMNDDDIKQFRDRLLLQHFAVVDDINTSVTPYTQDVPFNAREACLNRIKYNLYRDFGALDVDNISAASKTATEIEASYQPMDEEADDFEYQLIEYIHQILNLMGIDDTPVFKRNRVTNQREQTETILLAANFLDTETIIKKLPFVTVDEAESILMKLNQEAENRIEQVE